MTSTFLFFLNLIGLNNAQLSKEIEVLNKFMRLLDTDPDKAYYGYFHVQKANEELAIDSLLISDDLFRSSDVATRKKYVALVESVRENGGTVYVFSTMHVSGQQLQQVSGVAAILRYSWFVRYYFRFCYLDSYSVIFVVFVARERYPLPDLEELEDIAAAYDEGLEVEDDDEELTEEQRKEREQARIREDMEDMGFN